MRKRLIVVPAFLLLGLALIVLPTRAQNILGLTVRPTEAMPADAPNGTADIVAQNGGYLVTVDLSAATDALKLEEFAGATTWVVWAVDMDGYRHNLGQLNQSLVLEDAPVDYLVARLYVTPESNATAATPAGEPVYSVTLRNVQEQAGPAPTATGAKPGAAALTTAAATTATPAAGAGAAATATKPAGDSPNHLPTTGFTAVDLLVLAVVAFVLVVLGLQLRTVRLRGRS
jgi:hypothetical protein